MAKLIDIIIDKIHQTLKADPNEYRKIHSDLDRWIRKIYMDTISQTSGYCMNLKVPSTEVLGLFSRLNINPKEVSNAILTQLEIPQSAHMWSNPFYHMCLLLILYGSRFNDEKMQKSGLTLLLALLWNGRKTSKIRHCDPDTMRYVVANLTNKHKFKKFDSPLNLITAYFVPTLMQKYSPMIKSDSSDIKRLFSQAWSRLDQMFTWDYAPDLITGEKKARRGIATEYYKAKKEGLAISKPRMLSSFDDEQTSPMEQHTTNPYDEIVSTITNYVVMNFKPKYDSWFYDFVQDSSKVNRLAIESVLHGMHNIRLTDHIREIVELLARHLQITNNNTICSQKFITDEVKKKIISSKNNPNVIQLKKIIDLLLDEIFKKNIPYVNYTSYSPPSQGKLRKVIIYGIAYNIHKYICFDSKK